VPAAISIHPCPKLWSREPWRVTRQRRVPNISANSVKEEEAIAAGVMPPPRVDPRLGLNQLPRRRWDHGRGWH